MVVDVTISQKKIPPDRIFPRSYMDFEQKYQKYPGMNRVKVDNTVREGHGEVVG